jgi:hypothetical protein
MVLRTSRMHWLTTINCLLVLLTGLVWYQEHWGRPTGAAITVPFGPAHALYINIWKPGPDYDPGDRDRHDRLIPGEGPMRMAIWYQDTMRVTTRRLGIINLPSWPLIMLCGSSIAIQVIARRIRSQRQLLCNVL